MLCVMLVIIVNAFVNIKAYMFVIIYERKTRAFQVVYFCFNVMSLQLLYY